MREVDRDLAHKVFDLLEAGKTPYAFEDASLTSNRTARRLKTAKEGFEKGKSDGDIAKATGWSEQLVAQVRNWWKEYHRTSTQTGSVFESRVHRGELFHFGQRLWDRLAIPNPVKVVRSKPGPPYLWSGEVSSVAPRNDEEAFVAKEWGYGRTVDATTHPLFEAFKQHLRGHQCWLVLEDLQNAYQPYCNACHKVCQDLRQRMQVLGQAPEAVEVVAQALLGDLMYRKELRRSHLIQPMVVKTNDAVWELELGGGFIECTSV